MINKALEVAVDGTGHKQRLGCVVTDRRGRMIAAAHNIAKTHPLQHKYSTRVHRVKPFLHAEIAALVRCRAQPHTLYVARLKRDGSVGLARPCPICEEAIREAGVKRVVYTTNGGGTEEYIVR